MFIKQQLADVCAFRNGTAWLARPHDRQRNYDPARPGRHFIQIYRRPFGQKDDLGWHCRTAFPGILPEDREIDSSEAVCRVESAETADHLARFLHVRSVRRIAQQLEHKVSLRRGAHFWRTAFVDRPTSLWQHPVANVIASFSAPLFT